MHKLYCIFYCCFTHTSRLPDVDAVMIVVIFYLPLFNYLLPSPPICLSRIHHTRNISVTRQCITSRQPH